MPSAPTSNPQPAVGPLAGPGFASWPFLCKDCGMNFAWTGGKSCLSEMAGLRLKCRLSLSIDLKRHQNTHVPGVKKTHPCPYCAKNLSWHDAVKCHVVSKQCPITNDNGYGWPPPEGHVPPPPLGFIELNMCRRGETPYPVLAVSPSDRSGSYSSGGYGNGSPGSPATYSPNGYNGGGSGFNGISGPGGYGEHGPGVGPTSGK